MGMIPTGYQRDDDDAAAANDDDDDDDDGSSSRPRSLISSSFFPRSAKCARPTVPGAGRNIGGREEKEIPMRVW